MAGGWNFQEEEKTEIRRWETGIFQKIQFWTLADRDGRGAGASSPSLPLLHSLLFVDPPRV